jgi:hypothetical protein
VQQLQKSLPNSEYLKTKSKNWKIFQEKFRSRDHSTDSKVHPKASCGENSRCCHNNFLRNSKNLDDYRSFARVEKRKLSLGDTIHSFTKDKYIRPHPANKNRTFHSQLDLSDSTFGSKPPAQKKVSLEQYMQLSQVIQSQQRGNQTVSKILDNKVNRIIQKCIAPNKRLSLRKKFSSIGPSYANVLDGPRGLADYDKKRTTLRLYWQKRKEDSNGNLGHNDIDYRKDYINLEDSVDSLTLLNDDPALNTGNVKGKIHHLLSGKPNWVENNIIKKNKFERRCSHTKRLYKDQNVFDDGRPKKFDAVKKWSKKNTPEGSSTSSWVINREVQSKTKGKKFIGSINNKVIISKRDCSHPLQPKNKFAAVKKDWTLQSREFIEKELMTGMDATKEKITFEVNGQTVVCPPDLKRIRESIESVSQSRAWDNYQAKDPDGSFTEIDAELEFLDKKRATVLDQEDQKEVKKSIGERFQDMIKPAEKS